MNEGHGIYSHMLAKEIEALRREDELHASIVHGLRSRGWSREDAINRADEIVSRKEQKP